MIELKQWCEDGRAAVQEMVTENECHLGKFELA